MKIHDFQLLFGRDDGIWTHSLCVPNATLYQIEPHLDIKFFGFKNNSLCGQICGQSHFFAFLENFKSALKQGVSTGLTIWGFIFEPLEPYSRTRRSTKLSHTPILNFSFKLHAWKCIKLENLFKYPLRCPKLFARCSLRTILTADAFRAPFIVHRTRSHSS